LIEKSIADRSEVHLAFIDLDQAYDRVPRFKLWNALKQLSINRHLLLGIIIKLYIDNTSYIKIGSHLSEPIAVNKGLKQGCGMSRICRSSPLHMEESLPTMAMKIQDSYDLEFIYDEELSFLRICTLGRSG